VIAANVNALARSQTHSSKTAVVAATAAGWMLLHPAPYLLHTLVSVVSSSSVVLLSRITSLSFVSVSTLLVRTLLGAGVTRCLCEPWLTWPGSSEKRRRLTRTVKQGGQFLENMQAIAIGLSRTWGVEVSGLLKQRKHLRLPSGKSLPGGRACQPRPQATVGC